jgi:thiamine-monophosphate kinase
MRVCDIGEFDLIERLKGIFGADAPPGVEVGIGDDAAVIQPAGKARLVVTTDALIENVHFLTRRIEPRLLGRRALAANLSDVAAMGAQPRYALLVLGLRSDANVEYVLELAKGMAELGAEHQTRIIGGDITRSPAALSITITLVGEAVNGVLTRSGAHPGDLIIVTGDLGGSAAGMGIAANPSAAASLPQEAREALLKRHCDPTPRVREGLLLARQGLATAAIDISDGLAGDLRHICEMSGVGASLDPEAIPIAHATRLAAAWLGQDATVLALQGGEDYELLFTCTPANADAVVAALVPTPVTSVGAILAEPGLRLVGPAAERYERRLHSYDHFRAPSGG